MVNPNVFIQCKYVVKQQKRFFVQCFYDDFNPK